ncbi:ABC transporter substrate-binding protein [Bacillus sp. AGMB 02131]|uniref:ABC transporter substrate-binding protein n=1 Tax=Peribacillus faecalis TaxID=2772559 RepID=A0A927H9Z3_9BACI|nr:ABC transporter substrate-binding protein [Peribacillus faecalis]MBD3107002.1 ABC transporter substrate-binding protein [Peribacillus faecalis]
MRKYHTFLISVLCLFLLSACNNDNTQDINNAESITVTDANGEVTIPADAQRIVASNMEDSLVALGITPVRQWAIGTTVHEYLQNVLADVPTIEWDMPLEQVIEAEPDLIIFSSPSAVPTGQLEEYQQVAPTYVFTDENAADWRKQIKVIGEMLGKEKQAEDVLSGYDEKAADATETVKEAIGNESVAAIWMIGGQYYVLENNRYASNVLYEDLGLTMPSFIKKLGDATDATWSPISLESLADLDAEHVFLIAAEGEAGLETLTASSIWQGTPAAQNGNVYKIGDDGSWTINGKIASDKVIDTVVETLTK